MMFLLSELNYLLCHCIPLLWEMRPAVVISKFFQIVPRSHKKVLNVRNFLNKNYFFISFSVSVSNTVRNNRFAIIFKKTSISINCLFFLYFNFIKLWNSMAFEMPLLYGFWLSVHVQRIFTELLKLIPWTYIIFATNCGSWKILLTVLYPLKIIVYITKQFLTWYSIYIIMM